MKLKISNAELRKYLNINPPSFPKYSTSIINLANQFAQGTRPKVVGQMSELIQEFSGKSLSEWEKWYVNKNPQAIVNATEKIVKMIGTFRETLDRVDKDLIERWVKDLVIVKTFIGLRCQEAILKKVAENKGCKYKLATPEEESKGIDGFLDNISVSVKPITYKSKPELQEKIKAKFIYYEKKKDGVEITFEDF